MKKALVVSAHLLFGCNVAALAQSTNSTPSPSSPAPSGTIAASATSGPKAEADSLVVATISDSIGQAVQQMKTVPATSVNATVKKAEQILHGKKEVDFVLDAPPISTSTAMAVVVTDQQIQQVTASIVGFNTDSKQFCDALDADQSYLSNLAKGKLSIASDTGSELENVGTEAASAGGIITDAVTAVTTLFKTFKSQYTFNSESLSPDQDAIDRLLKWQIQQAYGDNAVIYDFTKLMILKADPNDTAISQDYSAFSTSSVNLGTMGNRLKAASNEINAITQLAKTLNVGVNQNDAVVKRWNDPSKLQTINSVLASYTSIQLNLSGLATSLTTTLTGSAAAAGGSGTTLAQLEAQALLVGKLASISDNLFLISCRPLIADASMTPLTRVILEDEVAISSSSIIDLEAYDMSTGACLFTSVKESRGYDLYSFSNIRDQARGRTQTLMLPPSENDPTRAKTYNPRITDNFTIVPQTKVDNSTKANH